jgi:hypothetical protein
MMARPHVGSERRIQSWDDLAPDERLPAYRRLRALALYVGRSAHGATVALADLRAASAMRDATDRASVEVLQLERLISADCASRRLCLMATNFQCTKYSRS